MERLVREQVIAPPAECLRATVEPVTMTLGRDWRDAALANGELVKINAAIVTACQDHWRRVEASAREPPPAD